MSRRIIFLLILIPSVASFIIIDRQNTVVKNYSVECDDNSCFGEYNGPEFINGDDVAHQFSNTMCKKVGDHLKFLYKQSKYSKVNLNNITMSTKGMGTGKVCYKLQIPFIIVNDKCDAYTSFDHVGGWHHKPALNSRIKQLQKALLPRENLQISTLKTTHEGLQEYWIQWKNKVVQEDCK